ncbi:cold shock domain-containing protein [Phocaeicola dorei]|jgi:cold shock CspA family protein|nr:cold shock domain-containing protein [Phocaeicola dorei]
MIAYVDENGMITDTPPISNNKPQEVDMSTIEVSTPRRTEEPIELVHEGRIEHFNVSKGYGFVKDLKNAEKYFFHISGLIDNIIENNIVTFELEKGSRGMNAVKIKLKK